MRNFTRTLAAVAAAGILLAPALSAPAQAQAPQGLDLTDLESWWNSLPCATPAIHNGAWGKIGVVNAASLNNFSGSGGAGTPQNPGGTHAVTTFRNAIHRARWCVDWMELTNSGSQMDRDELIKGVTWASNNHRGIDRKRSDEIISAQGWWGDLEDAGRRLAIGAASDIGSGSGSYPNGDKLDRLEKFMYELAMAAFKGICRDDVEICGGMAATDTDPDTTPKPTLEGNFSMVEGWWNHLTDCSRMNAAVNSYDPAIEASGRNSGYCAAYADLGAAEKDKVHKAAMEIDGRYTSIQAWWEALDCDQMSIATGYERPRYCGHFMGAPKATDTNTLSAEQEKTVAIAGFALATGRTATFDVIMAHMLWKPFTAAVPALPLAGLGVLGLLLGGRGAYLRRRRA